MNNNLLQVLVLAGWAGTLPLIFTLTKHSSLPVCALAGLLHGAFFGLILNIARRAG